MLKSLVVQVVKGGYISFYLNREFYELNLSSFNNMFGFLLSLNLPYWRVPQEFNANAYSSEILGDYCYNANTSKGINTRNPYIQVT